MNRSEFDSKLERAFYGTGGGMFKGYYIDSLKSSDTLQKIAEDIKNDIKLELNNPKCWDNYLETEISHMQYLLEKKIDSNIDCYKFFCEYLADSTCSHPELCGSIVGAMVKLEMFDESLELIGMNDIGENDQLYWDS